MLTQQQSTPIHTPSDEQIITRLERRIFELETQLDKQSSQLEDIASMALMITSLLDLNQILAAVMEMSIRAVGAEVGCILFLDAGSLETEIAWGLDSERAAEIRTTDGTQIALEALALRKTVVLSTTDGGLIAGPEVSCAMAIPITTRTQSVGVLVVVNSVNESTFSETDRHRLEMLVRFASVAIDNADLLKEKLKKQRLEQELSIARAVQQALLPQSSEQFDRCVIETAYQPAGQIGGDYFDIIRLSDEQVVVIVGDVSDKGTPAALLMAAIRSVFRLQTGNGKSPAEVVTRCNRFLCENVMRSGSSFVSIVYAHLDLHNMVVRYVNAGHPPPLHYSGKSGAVSEWRRSGVVLGQFPESEYREMTTSLVAGDRVVFYTDGVTEATSAAGELFGRHRLIDALMTKGGNPPRLLTHVLLGAVQRHTNNATEVQDDTTILVVGLQ